MNFAMQLVVTLVIATITKSTISKFIEIPESMDNILKSYIKHLTIKEKVAYYHDKSEWWIQKIGVMYESDYMYVVVDLIKK